jgi:HPt (histidine-containing phosphotransfer) domain-containing protein
VDLKGKGVDKASHFDIEALTMLEEIMEDEFPELVNVFVTDSDPRIPALQQALENNETETLRELSHSFKGASGNLSALPLADLCYQIEEKSREGKTEGTAELIERVEQEYQSVKSILLAMIN